MITIDVTPQNQISPCWHYPIRTDSIRHLLADVRRADLSQVGITWSAESDLADGSYVVISRHEVVRRWIDSDRCEHVRRYAI